MVTIIIADHLSYVFQWRRLHSLVIHNYTNLQEKVDLGKPHLCVKLKIIIMFVQL